VGEVGAMLESTTLKEHNRALFEKNGLQKRESPATEKKRKEENISIHRHIHC
jgi:hypothetical protein